VALRQARHRRRHLTDRDLVGALGHSPARDRLAQCPLSLLEDAATRETPTCQARRGRERDARIGDVAWPGALNDPYSAAGASANFSLPARAKLADAPTRRLSALAALQG
jgi:hypothetical protein